MRSAGSLAFSRTASSCSASIVGGPPLQATFTASTSSSSRTSISRRCSYNRLGTTDVFCSVAAVGVSSLARTSSARTFSSSTRTRIHKNRTTTTSTSSRRAFSSTSPLLFTPGPLTTSTAVKNALLQDVGSRDPYFLKKMHEVRAMLVAGAQGGAATHDCVLIQGAGTHAIESVLGSVLAPEKSSSGANVPKVLILNNGAYGVRQKQICDTLNLAYESIDYPDDQAVSAEDLERRLDLPDGGTFTHVSFIHHETTAGVINPLTAICEMLQRKFPHLHAIVDSMSAFGAYEVDLSDKHRCVKYLISSANKCVEGVPGFAFCVYEKAAMETLSGKKPKSLALDLYGQAKALTSGVMQFRFTPPTQAILAYHQALLEWNAEGGWKGRGGRYKQNYEVIKQGLESMGLRFYVQDPHRGFIITTVLSPEHKNWDFQFLYDFLAQRGFVIYPGKLAKADSFRIGTIGKIFPADCENFLLVLRDGFRQLGIPIPVQ
ncbi:unnamed protein product [Amoebophrya sp. A25]|nr:unnamed protein product [Amoebophrya sp. A25]|eukprot:GSA25T00006718001.1